MEVEAMGSKKLVIVAAPSGAGKTTIVRHLLKCLKHQLAFSISATNRKARVNEVDGEDYYFLSTAAFKDKIKNQGFVEWEEVYENFYYGTLKNEVKRIWQSGKSVIFDVDVQGALNIKHKFPGNSLSVFINPPSIEALRFRLEKRDTETKHSIKRRLEKAALELQFKSKFDAVVLNDDLDWAKNKACEIVLDFLISDSLKKNDEI